MRDALYKQDEDLPEAIITEAEPVERFCGGITLDGLVKGELVEGGICPAFLDEINQEGKRIGCRVPLKPAQLYQALERNVSSTNSEAYIPRCIVTKYANT